MTSMGEADFVAYVGIPDIHDGTILRVSIKGSTAEVVIEGYSGCEHSIVFQGIRKVEMKEPEGMLLYSLSEMQAEAPFREFVFTSNNEDDDKYLSVTAVDFRIRSS
ncbi:hypothetical protein [Occallatibacter savannae]|uniref:hypothetical protein n=1 Tax=Occallatibacter savannae TaxID=1002691 RepID=UPI0013A55969|nr:hypothetical protein [Occallatibacter savannae]